MSVSLFVCRSVRLSVCLSTCPSVHPSIRPSVRQSVRWQTDWLSEWLSDWLMDSQTYWPTDRQTDILSDWLFEWLTDWLTDSLTVWLHRLLAYWLACWFSFIPINSFLFQTFVKYFLGKVLLSYLSLKSIFFDWFYGHKCDDNTITLCSVKVCSHLTQVKVKSMFKETWQLCQQSVESPVLTEMSHDYRPYRQGGKYSFPWNFHILFVSNESTVRHEKETKMTYKY